jgi:hypothetical protein
MTYPNWFSSTEALSNFEKFLGGMGGRPITCLQVGVYTGDATEWMANNILGHEDSRLWDVDTWQGSEEPVHKNMDFNDVYKTYTEKNKSFIGSKVIPFIGTSDVFFAGKPHDLLFDFIYIDGDHTAFQVVKDGVNGFLNLKPGGVMGFDDYTWSLGQSRYLDPAPAIDWILNILEGRIQVLTQSGQVWIQKF